MESRPVGAELFQADRRTDVSVPWNNNEHSYRFVPLVNKGELFFYVPCNNDEQNYSSWPLQQ